jgi:hypothetical protein
MSGTFNFVAAGPDKIWMISTGAERYTNGGKPLPGGVPADEIVSGEGVRIG